MFILADLDSPAGLRLVEEALSSIVRCLIPSYVHY